MTKILNSFVFFEVVRQKTDERRFFHFTVCSVTYFAIFPAVVRFTCLRGWQRLTGTLPPDFPTLPFGRFDPERQAGGSGNVTETSFARFTVNKTESEDPNIPSTSGVQTRMATKKANEKKKGKKKESPPPTPSSSDSASASASASGSASASISLNSSTEPKLRGRKNRGEEEVEMKTFVPTAKTHPYHLRSEIRDM